MKKHSKEEPPSYQDNPPPYTPYAIHYVSPDDTVAGIALMYGVEKSELKRVNRLHNDFFIPKRQLIIFNPLKLVQSAPDPLDERKAIITVFQGKTKCIERDIACCYLANAGWDLEKAVLQYNEDDIWEKEQIRNRTKKP